MKTARLPLGERAVFTTISLKRCQTKPGTEKPRHYQDTERTTRMRDSQEVNRTRSETG